MLINKFLGYREGAAVETIPPQYLTYPSKNCLIYKGVIQTRGGTENDGTAASGSNGIIGEFVWKDGKSGEQPLRAVPGILQLKYNDTWITIYSDISATATRVRFATWVDGTGTVIKKRCFFVDGSDSIHEWSGAVGVVASYAVNTATLDSAASSALLRGFDAGNVTPQIAIVVRFDADGNVLGTEEKTYTNDGTTNTIVFSGALTDAPQAGDIIIAKPVENSAVISGLEMDEIYCFPVTNHLVVMSFNSGEIYGSASDAKLDFVVPSAGSRTAASAFFLTLPGNITTVVSRSKGNSESQPETIWFSTEDGWYKVTPLSQASTITGHWFEIQALDVPPRSGALPYMSANFKGDIIFLSQDKRLQRIQTLELAGIDDISLLSDEVEGLLSRLDFDGGNMYYDARYIWIAAPAETHVLLLDMIGDPEREIDHFWNPPQIVPVSHISVIDGVRYGHSSVANETFTLFDGADDLGVNIAATIALGTNAAADTFLKYLAHETLGFSGKKSTTSVATVSQYFEKDGAKATDTFDLDDLKTYNVGDDNSIASVPWASRGYADFNSETLKRFFAFSKSDAISYFEHRLILEITGEAVTFHLHAVDVDVTTSAEGIGEDLFISR